MMRFMFHTLAVATAVVTLSGSAFAGQAKPAAAKPAKAAKVTVITMTGTVSKFDAATNTLTVKTPKSDAMFTVNVETTNVTADGKKVAVSDLPSHVGHKVTVRYTQSGGQKMAQSVSVTMAATKTASAKKAGAAKKS